MTEEEIKKFAKEYVQNNTDESVNSFIGEQLQKAFIEGTDFMYYSNNEELKKELTEKDKQIAELEKEVDEAKLKSGYSTYLEDKIKIDELERENKELKAGRDINVFTKQLTKAKDLIRQLCSMVRELNKPNVQLTNVDYSLTEAEQFLKECE